MGPHIASLLAWGTLPPLHHCPLTEVPDNGTTSRNWGCRGWNPCERVPRVRCTSSPSPFIGEGAWGVRPGCRAERLQTQASNTKQVSPRHSVISQSRKHESLRHSIMSRSMKRVSPRHNVMSQSMKHEPPRHSIMSQSPKHESPRHSIMSRSMKHEPPRHSIMSRSMKHEPPRHSIMSQSMKHESPRHNGASPRGK